MKRTRDNSKNSKSYKFNPSEVYKVTYLKARHHEVGEEDLVSLPVAIKFINNGLISSTPEIEEAITKSGMQDLITIKKGKL